MRSFPTEVVEVAEIAGLLKAACSNADRVLEGRIKLRSLDDWMRCKKLLPERSKHLQEILTEIRIRGFVDPMVGRISANEIGATEALREGLLARGVNSRQRAVLRTLTHRGARVDSRIYGAEAVTSLALRLRGTFPYFLGSEYTADGAARASLFPIPYQDLTDLTLPSDSFDFVTTNEVLEHVPDIDAALRSIARVLKPGGWHIGTVPFHYESRVGVVKARLINGKIEHLTTPEYHGNPFESGGSLVFELPGWDILARAIRVGFSEAFMEFTWSAEFGIVAEELGVFLLTLRR